jgi:hypothetical protein
MRQNIAITLYKIIYFIGFIAIYGCMSNANPNKEKINFTKDTCIYALKVPADLDISTTPHFDTTIVRSKECRIHILSLPSWGTETNYTITSQTGNQKSAHFFASKKGEIDITNLASGKYNGYLTACGNGGPFTIHIK